MYYLVCGIILFGGTWNVTDSGWAGVITETLNLIFYYFLFCLDHTMAYYA